MKQKLVLAIACMIVLASSVTQFAFSDFHDIALTNISLSANQIFASQDVRVEVSARNQGTVSETMNVTVCANGTSGTIDVDTYKVGSLGPSDQIVIPFLWNTEGVAQGNYTIVANASIIEGESNTANNIVVSHNITILEDQTSPIIDVPFRIPPEPLVPIYGFVQVLVNVTDSQTGVAGVILSWKANNETTWYNVSMNYASNFECYAVNMGGFAEETLVSYKIIAMDKAGNTEIRDNAGSFYTYLVISEYPQSPILLMLILATLAATVVWARKRANQIASSTITAVLMQVRAR